jgi:hypothetical protein
MLDENEVYFLPHSERLLRLRRITTGKTVPVARVIPVAEMGLYVVLFVGGLWLLGMATR